MISNQILNTSFNIAGCRFDVSIDKSYFHPKTASSMLHSHADYEIHLVKQGSYYFDINNSKINLADMSILIVSPNTYHSNSKPLDDLSEKYCFRIDLIDKGSKKENMIKNALESIDDAYVLHNCGHQIQLADEIYKEYKRMRLDYLNCISTLAYGIVLSVIRRIMHDNTFESKNKSINRYENRTSAIDVFFAENYMNDIHSKDLAEYVNLSIRQLDRIMRRYYKMTFKQKLTQMRIFAAKQLLAESELTIQEISQKIGYNSIENFSSSFREKIGSTPSAYRKTKTNNICNP